MKKLTAELIARSYPEAEFNYEPETETITWIDNKISDAQITELIAEYDAQEYARNRASAYDSVGNQLDQLMKDMRDGTTTHQESCEAVKVKFPKS